jgi:hypothetical protein
MKNLNKVLKLMKVLCFSKLIFILVSANQQISKSANQQISKSANQQITTSAHFPPNFFIFDNFI